jgi:hypothetical protein
MRTFTPETRIGLMGGNALASHGAELIQDQVAPAVLNSFGFIHQSFPMKALTMFLLLSSTPVPVHALSIRDALGQIESGNNDHATGKQGEVSRFQIKPSVWGRLTNLKCYSNPDFAWEIAQHILTERSKHFEERHKRKPTARELYALWNAPAQAMALKLSKSVADRADRFANLVELK